MKKLLALSLLSTFLLSACIGVQEEVKEVSTQSNNEANESAEQIAREKAESTNTEQSQVSGEMSETENPQYIAYSENTYNELLGKKPFALFFHAPWCPVCVGMEKDINANLSSFPANTVILKADFDTETELRKTYGITSQSTIVLVDKDGKAVKTLAGPESDEIKEELSALL